MVLEITTKIINYKIKSNGIKKIKFTKIQLKLGREKENNRFGEQPSLTESYAQFIKIVSIFIKKVTDRESIIYQN